jgi:hypothetical protein
LVRLWSAEADGWARGDATRALGALRVTNFPTTNTEEGWLFEIEQSLDSAPPLPRAGVVAPVATHRRDHGLVWVFPDGSGLALRHVDGATWLPSWSLVADAWTEDAVDTALGAMWTGAAVASDDEAWWQAPPDATDSITPWCPAVTVPPDLWRARLHAFHTCLALLADRWPATPMAQLTKADLSFVRVRQNGVWRMDITPSLHSTALPFDAWGKADPIWGAAAGRAALEGLAHRLFPGRMGFASSSLPGNSLHHQITPQPFLALPQRSLPSLTAHTRMAALDTAVRCGAWDHLAPFLHR